MTSILDEKVGKKITEEGKTRSCRLGMYEARSFKSLDNNPPGFWTVMIMGELMNEKGENALQEGRSA